MSFSAVNHPAKAAAHRPAESPEHSPLSAHPPPSSFRKRLSTQESQPTLHSWPGFQARPSAARPDSSQPSTSKAAGQHTNSRKKSSAAARRLPQSEPMTATDSASSSAPHKDQAPSNVADASDAKAEDGGNGAIGYGTRSRNRPSNARPNYAEDNEMDFEVTAQATNGSSRSQVAIASRHSDTPAASDASHSQSPTLRRHSTAAGYNGGEAGAASGSIAHRDGIIPGTVTFSANPNTGNSKKRKAGHSSGGNASQPSTSQSSNALASTTTATRRSAATVDSNLKGAASKLAGERLTNMMFYESSSTKLVNGSIRAEDGTLLSIDDHVYLISEPPGEPYYICRIMEFVHAKDDKSSPMIDSIRCNWYYRPREVGHFQHDSRLLYATMHSDVCPITSLRGKCRVSHRAEPENIEKYRQEKDSFYFTQLFDRFIHRRYEVLPCTQVINVPERIKKVLDERWKYIVVESNMVKQFTSDVKLCKKCSGYCASNDSVDCAVCKTTYHMTCVSPPLLKKPSRGFAWACGPCSRAQEKKLEARRTPLMGDASAMEAEDEEIVDEEEEDPAAAANTTAPSPASDEMDVEQQAPTQAEIALAKMWPMRYLGMHCTVEDVLQYDDRTIYPRASSRLGPRHQANENAWLISAADAAKAAENKKRNNKNAAAKKDGRAARDSYGKDEKPEKAKRSKKASEKNSGPPRRGEDYSATEGRNAIDVGFKMPSLDDLPTRGMDDAPTDVDKVIDDYMVRAKAMAKHVGVKEYNTNFLDKAVRLFYDNGYDADAALKQLRRVDKFTDLREPKFDNAEAKRFEDAVSKHGSEWRLLRLAVRTRPHRDIVRHWYMWKKTPKGREVWAAYPGRKSKPSVRKVENEPAQLGAKLADDIADNQDDSAFDVRKASRLSRPFQCKFCHRRHSRQWRRAPGVAPGSLHTPDGRTKDKTLVTIALCGRCGVLWRKYAVEFEYLDEATRKSAAQSTGKAWKRQFEPELLNALDEDAKAKSTPSSEVETPGSLENGVPDLPKKKQKLGHDRDGIANGINPSTAATKPQAEVVVKKKLPPPPPKEPTPPPVPDPPRMKDHACRVCGVGNKEKKFSCLHCFLTVHPSCYGIDQKANPNHWLCDPCMNDKKETVSYSYSCVLCPAKLPEEEMLEAHKATHKKKNDRDREKERLEKELAVQWMKDFSSRQRDLGRPERPREPLKRTAENNWVHTLCAVWTPETRFSSADRLDIVEGIGPPSIPIARYQQECKICKTNKGACVNCHHCHTSFHVMCAYNAGHKFGFDITPVKSSRRDHISVVTVGPETGAMTAAIWCKEHSPKTIVHDIDEIVDDATKLNALQLFAQTYKQADLTYTGTARKAMLLDNFAKAAGPASAPSVNRKVSLTGTVTKPNHARRSSLVKSDDASKAEGRPSTSSSESAIRRCNTCGVEASPKWYPLAEPSRSSAAMAVSGGLSNGIASTSRPVVNGTAPAKFECHQCHYNRKHAKAPIQPQLESSRPSQSSPPRRDPPLVHQAWSQSPAPQVATSPTTQQSSSRPAWMPGPPAHLPLTNGMSTSPAGQPAALHGFPRGPLGHYSRSPDRGPPVNVAPPVAHAPLPPAEFHPPPLPPQSAPPPSAPPALPLVNGPAAPSPIAGLPSPIVVRPADFGYVPSASVGLPMGRLERPPVSIRAGLAGPGASPQPPHPVQLTSPQQLTPTAASAPRGWSSRPATPRDSRDVAATPPGNTTGGGASASPNLRNLLH